MAAINRIKTYEPYLTGALHCNELQIKSRYWCLDCNELQINGGGSMQSKSANNDSENPRCEVCGRLKALHHGKNMCDYFNVSAKTDTDKLQADEDMPCVFCSKPKSEHYGKPGKVQPGDRFRLRNLEWATVVSVDGDMVTFKVDGRDGRNFTTVRGIYALAANVGPAFRCRPDYASSTYVTICAGSANDPINNPAHYTFGKIEVADAIDDWQLNIWRGTALKYIVRAGRKHKGTELEDLKKAAWYLAREIARMEKVGAK